MSRKADRAEIVGLLQAITAPVPFLVVSGGVLRTLQGESPVAMVSGLGLEPVDPTFGTTDLIASIVVTICVLNDTADVADAEAAEDVFDDLVEAAMLTLHEAGYTVQRSSAEPYGAPLVRFEGPYYRVERLVVVRADEL